MKKFKGTLALPVEDLAERRRVLEKELSKTVLVLTKKDLTSDLLTLFEKFGLTGTFTLSWDFGSESDDEGGSYVKVHYLTLSDENEEDIKLYEVKSPDSGSLDDELYDMMNEYAEDLDAHDIESITVTVKGEE
ncbi:hypothetical protein JMA_39290 (plasmid) [Jeotgalibacillus malaysiensis]|uniref:Uncharacterized protein n=1 Tax=Jeotgalibacillus malaysiensis TaxID=1508404 RepID=A0A0B5AX26_9BACL|nr:hypothetical protein [Jeotgalibacillus malaysiensis]AJD93247.1 hypothetical protein JMA_39290 [Jeotgalibacillus malaysiensis]